MVEGSKTSLTSSRGRKRRRAGTHARGPSPQQELPLPDPSPKRKRGGKRRGAGRKAADGRRAGVAHRPRAPIRRKTPVHVTLRLVGQVGNVRRFKLAPAMRRAFAGGAVRRAGGFRICQFSIQHNHLHLVTEADSNQALARGVQGFEIRFARRLNRKLGRKGKVFADRFHAVPVRSPRHLRNTLCYVLNNARRHGERLDPVFGGVDPFSSAWHFDGWSDLRWREGRAPPTGPPCVAEAESWLLTDGWLRWGRIGVAELPLAAKKLFPTREAWLGMDDE